MSKYYLKPQGGTKSADYYFCPFVLFCGLSTTDEVHDLDPIVIAQHCSNPVTATHYFTIEFDRNASGRQIKLAD